MGKFRIKISTYGFSDDFVKFRYTTNCVFWKNVKGYKYDILENHCHMTTKIIHFRDAENFLSKFKAIEDVIEYEKKEKQRVIEHNKEISDLKIFNKNNMTLQENHSYLLKYENSSILLSMTILLITKEAYKISWRHNDGTEHITYEEKRSFNSIYSILEDITDYEK